MHRRIKVLLFAPAVTGADDGSERAASRVQELLFASV
jgi:hypothetical protein